ncbi:trypsin-like peptidase domain-containing protein [Nostocoides sp.]|uniref:S1C family serine protease n=1 Tax=Nostocoides sp. TaxID=1917966 RepID=UPI002C45F296|nr:trypsin-like peptidase domain-containing protein [Tetrasphaera sp.]
MSQPGTSTGTPSPNPPSSPWSAAERPDTDATAPLWFGDRVGAPAPDSAPTPTTWSAPVPPSDPPAATPSLPRRPRRTWPGLVAVSLLSAGLASGGTYAAVRAADGPGATPTAPSAATQNVSPATTSAAQDIRQINPNAPDWTATAATVTPSVVAITVATQGGGSQGSGVIIDGSGHILTNNHVVDGAQEGGLQVTLADGRIHDARIAGTDPSTDLAVVTITDPPSDLKAIALGDSAALRVGDPVMAVGNPLGLAGTVTTGIISALNRPVTTGDNQGQGEPVYTNAVQTSAAINPGNSGGALVDADGKLIGINSSIASTGSNSGNIGIGFAIPVNEAKVIADQLIATGAAEHAFLGVNLGDGEGQDGTATRAGARIAAVTPNTPAATAGLRAGDIVVAIKGITVESRDSLIAHIRAERVGAQVTLTVLRGGARQDIEVTLAARPAG